MAHISSSQLPVKIFFNQEQGQDRDGDGDRAGLLLRNSKLIETINEELIIKAQVLRWHLCMSAVVSDVCI